MNKNRMKRRERGASGEVTAKPISIKSSERKSGGCAERGALGARAELRDFRDDLEAREHRAARVVFVGGGVAEIEEETVALVSGDVSATERPWLAVRALSDWGNPGGSYDRASGTQRRQATMTCEHPSLESA
jgi:hypothetical protein